MEGNHCYPPGASCDPSGLIPPITEYPNPAEGISVIGGFVYRGSAIPALVGTHVFGDLASGNVWGLKQDAVGNWQRTLVLTHNHLVTSFGRDADGELYLVDYNGAVLRLVSATAGLPVISGVTAESITASEATINWTTNVAADSQVEYGFDTTYGSLTMLDASLVSSHGVALGGLAAETLYHYRVHSSDAFGNATMSSDFTFTTAALPVISGVTADSITASEATINWTTNVAADSQVEYGLDTTYGSLTMLDATLVTSHAVAVSGLTAETLYHYRVHSTDGFGNATVSGDFTFTTAALPVINEVTADSITASEAIINWTTNVAADSQVEYGLDTTYGSSTTLDATLVTSHTVAVSGLTAETLYHYRVHSTDGFGNATVSGDFTFTTAALPVISGVAADSISTTAATINWTTNVAADSQVEYGLDTTYGSLTMLDATLVTSHAVALGGLTGETLYHYRVHSSDVFGDATVSGDFTFTTAALPVITSIELNPSTVVGGNLTQGTVTLNGPAPIFGTVVELWSSDTSVTAIPATVTIPVGASSASFTINTFVVTRRKNVRIRASYQGTTKQGRLTVTP